MKTWRRHQSLDAAAGELGARCGRPDSDDGVSYAASGLQEANLTSGHGGQLEEDAFPNGAGNSPDRQEEEERFYPARETFDEAHARAHQPDLGNQDHARRRQETLQIVDRRNELYEVCKSMSNATFSRIASWAYAPQDSVASDVDPEWSECCKELDPPSSFGKVGLLNGMTTFESVKQ